MPEEGRVHVYTGDGKGKTTAAIGLAVRAACAGMRVYVGQFLKAGSSESSLPERFPGLLELEHYGRPGFVDPGSPSPLDRDLAARGLSRFAGGMARAELAVADEILVAVDLGLLPEGDVLALIAGRPPGTELVLTGRYRGGAVLEAADLVTEMVARKHYMAAGAKARRGIEY